MFRNVHELVQQAQDQNKKLYEIMIDQESELTEKSRKEVIGMMDKQFQVMKSSAMKPRRGRCCWSTVGCWPVSTGWRR